MEVKLQPLPSLTPQDALLVIDLQKDFLPGGALAVAEGDQVIAPINRLIPSFSLVVATQDWHPKDHCSFQNQGGIWPSHCIQGSEGASFAEGLYTEGFHCILRKGTDPEVDSYSAFFDNERKHSTGLSGLLQEKKIKRVFLAGLALDFCVFYTAKDARELGFETFVILEATRAVDVDKSKQKALQSMEQIGVKFISLSL